MAFAMLAASAAGLLRQCTRGGVLEFIGMRRML